MRILVGDEFGLLKCVDTTKKIVDSKYGEISKNNSVLAIDNLYSSKLDVVTVLHQYQFYVFNWGMQEVVSKPVFSVDFDKDKDVEFNSMNVIKNDSDKPYFYNVLIIFFLVLCVLVDLIAR
jgi:C4-dicarboxylate transporter